MHSVADAADRQLNDTDKQFLGHPRGLAFLGFTEGWERFSFYGMQTLLVLYMAKQLLLPGHVEHIAGFTGVRAALESAYGHPLSVIALGSAIYGVYSGSVWITPILGGLIADRWLGRTRTITIGAVLMAAGHFLMAFEAPFLLALACLLIGVGCFKGNLASQVGSLYSAADLRRADAYQIYYVFINAGVIIAPLVAGTLGERYGWHYGFGIAGVGMLISLAVYRAGRHWLPPDAPVVRSARSAAGSRRLPPGERRAMIALLLLLPALALAAVGNQQIFNAYLLWVPDHADMTFFGQTMPTSWLITVDAGLSLGALGGSLLFWRLWALRFPEPSEVTKIAIGMLISMAGLLMLVVAGSLSAGGQRIRILWPLAFDTLNSIGYANVFPVGLALYARASPRSLAATMIGIYYGHLFVA
ncbi:MAG TPA: peptide MFS transporter, partial [Steroidobacteraceae bacterium]|nr:peptide MFS transporter [Steroidobacteraceae bacterium]